MIRLSGFQQAELENALIDAFPSKDELARFLKYRLSKNLDAIAMGDNLSIIVYKLIQDSQARGWTDELIARAREANPRNPELVAFCQTIGVSPQAPDTDALERIIVKQNSFLDVSIWRQKLGELENQVCRVEVGLNDGTVAYGTGFLISPNLVITNYHVVKAVIESKSLQQTGKAWAAAEHVALRFDFKLLFGNVVNPGVIYRLADDWLVDNSPMSHWDQTIPPQGGNPSPDELDYALLRLKGKPGNDTVGILATPDATAPRRGWIKFPEQEYGFQAGSPLLILQHPKAAALKLAFDTNAILGLNGNKTRVTYRTNTEPGSSGSPCFSLNWELVALHHVGDPDSITPRYNQGIPLKAILELLQLRGKLALI